MTEAHLSLFLRTTLSLLSEDCPFDILTQLASSTPANVRERLLRLSAEGETYAARDGRWRYVGKQRPEQLLRQWKESLAGHVLSPFEQGLLLLSGENQLTGIRRLLDALPELLARDALTELGALLEIGMSQLAGLHSAALAPAEHAVFLESVCFCYTYVILLEIKQNPMLHLLADIRRTAERQGNERALCLVDIMECMLEGLLSDQIRSDKAYRLQVQLQERMKRLNDAEMTESGLYFAMNFLFNGCRSFLHHYALMGTKRPGTLLSEAIRYLYVYGANAAALHLGHSTFAVGLCEAARGPLQRKSPYYLRNWNICHAIALFENGDTEKCLERVTESLCTLRPGSETRPYLMACHILARYQLFAGHVGRSRRMMETLLSHSARYGISATYPISWFWDLHLHYRLNGLPDFENFSLEADLERGMANQSKLVRAFALRTRALLGKAEGRHDEALSLLEQSAALLEASEAPCELARTWLYTAYADPNRAPLLRGKALALLSGYTSLDYSRYPFFPGTSAVDAPMRPQQETPRWARKALESCAAFLSDVTADSLDGFYALLVHLFTVELDAQRGFLLRREADGFNFVIGCNVVETEPHNQQWRATAEQAATDGEATCVRTGSGCLLCVPFADGPEKAVLVLFSPNERKIFAASCAAQWETLAVGLAAELRAFLRLRRERESE
ncbi:hypothetical protein, partial [uncultured Bilophila sp.]|uniref:hypothetical protein n=1 Tax=uncultured Bilophila sp. TaxID=529385 RepID=UPI0025EB609C